MGFLVPHEHPYISFSAKLLIYIFLLNINSLISHDEKWIENVLLCVPTIKCLYKLALNC